MTFSSHSALSWGERPTHQPVAGFTKDPFLNATPASGDIVGGGLPDIITQARISNFTKLRRSKSMYIENGMSDH